MINVIYPGSFDPITNGHLDVISRGIDIFGKIVIVVGNNINKNYLFSLDERIKLIEKSLPKEKFNQIELVGINGLIADFINENNVKVLIRGLRAISDFDLEFQLNDANKMLAPKCHTIFLPTNESYRFISSSFIKELASLGGDVSKFTSNEVNLALQEKYKK